MIHSQRRAEDVQCAIAAHDGSWLDDCGGMSAIPSAGINAARRIRASTVSPCATVRSKVAATAFPSSGDSYTAMLRRRDSSTRGDVAGGHDLLQFLQTGPAIARQPAVVQAGAATAPAGRIDEGDNITWQRCSIEDAVAALVEFVRNRGIGTGLLLRRQVSPLGHAAEPQPAQPLRSTPILRQSTKNDPCCYSPSE